MPTAPSDHREHLTVPLGWWLLALGFALTLVIAVGAYTTVRFAAATAVLALVVVAGLFLGYGRAQVAVDPRGLRAGRALVEWPWVQAVEPLDADQMHRATGPGALATAYLVVRPYVRSGVKVVLDDPADPHPYWLVSTRHPQRLARAAAAHLAGRGTGKANPQRDDAREVR